MLLWLARISLHASIDFFTFTFYLLHARCAERRESRETSDEYQRKRWLFLFRLRWIEPLNDTKSNGWYSFTFVPSYDQANMFSVEQQQRSSSTIGRHLGHSTIGCFILETSVIGAWCTRSIALRGMIKRILSFFPRSGVKQTFFIV